MQSDSSTPSFMQPLHTDEYRPLPPSKELTAAVKLSYELAENMLDRRDARFWSTRRGTAAGLLALNKEHGAKYYVVPGEAVEDLAAANEALGGDQAVIDIQTHYIADRPAPNEMTSFLLHLGQTGMPSWWKGLEGLAAYNFAEYMRCVFLESETAVAVLTSGPGPGPSQMLFNQELAATRRLLDELAPRQRLLHHAIVHGNLGEDLEQMGPWAEALRPAAWKTYTVGEPQWSFDDDQYGRRFLDRVRELGRVGGPKRVCVHKGISGLVSSIRSDNDRDTQDDRDRTSPRDIGPAASEYPDIDFLVYHSGYELAPSEEREFSDEDADRGTNRLIKSLRDNKISPGSNVYAELGTTWFWMIRRPREAAHVLGKLLLAVGEDNVLWGTDGIWYGPTQPLIDAFRAFQIPIEMQDEFGYPALTDAVKDKILSLNAARVYGIDLEDARYNAQNDELAWIKEAFTHYERKGSPV